MDVLTVGSSASSYLSEVSWMVFVEVDPVMVLTSGVTASTRMLTVLANTTVTMGHVAAKLTGLLFVGRHDSLKHKMLNQSKSGTSRQARCK